MLERKIHSRKIKLQKNVKFSYRSHGYSESSPVGYCEQVLRIANQFSLANMQDMLANNYIYNGMLGATQVQGNQRLMFLNHWYCGPALRATIHTILFVSIPATRPQAVHRP